MALQSALELSYYTTLSLWHIFKTFLYLGMMVADKLIPCCIVMILVMSNMVQSFRPLHMNELANGLNNAGFHGLDLQYPFNSWGGKTSGISSFVSAPSLATLQGYYIPAQHENILMNWNMQRSPLSGRSRKRAPFNAWAGKRFFFDPRIIHKE